MANKILNLVIGTDLEMPSKIDKIYLVNLDTRPDRLESLYTEEPYLKNIITRIPAVNGKTLTIDSRIYELFKNNIQVTNESNQVLKLFKDGKIIETHQYMGIVPATMVTRLKVGKEIYLIEWWFKNDNNKLSGISILKT